MPTAERHLILFDGRCGLCSRAVQFVLRRDRSAAFDFAPLESDVARSLLLAAGYDMVASSTFVVVERYGEPEARLLVRSRAVLFVAIELGWPWSMARWFDLLPTALLDRIYDVVAANRYRVFGRRAQCFMPTAEDRARFIESDPR